MKNKYMEEKEREMLSLYSMMFHFRQKSWWVLKLSLQPFFGGEDLPHKDSADRSRSVCVIRGGSIGTAELMGNLKGTWSHDEAFPAFNQSTDVYRFVSLLQCSTVYSVTCKVIQRDGYVLLHCGCEDAVERACRCGGLFNSALHC